jgi:hypothetical protein
MDILETLIKEYGDTTTIEVTSTDGSERAGQRS